MFGDILLNILKRKINGLYWIFQLHSIKKKRYRRMCKVITKKCKWFLLLRDLTKSLFQYDRKKGKNLNLL